MAIDLNADVGTIMKGLFGGGGKQDSGSSGASASKPAKDMPKFLQDPYRNIVISGVSIVLFIVAFIFLLYLPGIKSNEEKREEISRLNGMQEEIKNMQMQIKGLENAMAKSQDHYAELLAKFSNSEDLGELYQSISELALMYNLVVLNLKEVPKQATPVAKVKKSKKGEAVAAPKPLVEVSGIKVDVELKGWYKNYIKFREELANNEELLTINLETIEVGGDKEDQGKITVKMQISTYAINKDPYLSIVGEGESND